MNPPKTLTEVRRAELDAAAMELLQMHGVEQQPVPIEDILRQPAGDLWKPDLADLSLQSFDLRERYAARPTIARLVARYVGGSDWARQRGLVGDAGFMPDEVRYMARALLMPKAWIDALPRSKRYPASVRTSFHVPVSDAAERLAELYSLRVESDSTRSAGHLNE